MRYDNIDIARGLAILIVISWHVLGVHSPWTDGWAMAIFFFIMGIFYKQPECFAAMVKKKALTLLVPWLAYSIPAFISLIMTASGKEILMKIVNPYGCIHGVSWFLICMFWCYVIYYFIHKYLGKNINYVFVVALLISLLGFYSGKVYIMGRRIVLPMFFSTSMTAIIFVALGEKLKDYFKVMTRLSYKMLFLGGLLFSGGVIVLSPSVCDYIWNNFVDNYIVFIFNGLVAFYFIIPACKMLPSQMTVIGKYSLLMLMIHPYIIDLIKHYVEGFPLYFIVVILSVILSLLCARFIPRLSGISKK